MPGEKLVDAMMKAAAAQGARETPTDFVYGTVISVSPLRIEVEGKFPVDEGNLILSCLAKPFVTTLLKHRHLCEKCEDFDDIQLDPVMVWRGLAIGDRVRMLQCNSGQKFYVLERDEGLP